MKGGKQLHVGNTSIDWHYNILECLVKCAKEESLNAFDKVICAVLNLNEHLSIEQIGHIIGFNIIDNPQENQYKDNSEFSILESAIKSLLSYELIEIAVENGCDVKKTEKENTQYRLTNKGKEALKLNKKFSYLTHTILVYIDHFGNNHLAKKMFENNTGVTKGDKINIQENDLAEIIQEQNPDIINNSKGISIISISIQKQQSYELNVETSIFYDYLGREYNVDCKIHYNDENVFNQVIESDENIKKIIVKNLFQNKEESILNKPIVQESYESSHSFSDEKFDKIAYDDDKTAIENDNNQIRVFGFQDFFENLITILPIESYAIHFFIKKMTKELVSSFNFISKIFSANVFCVEFEEGEDDDNYKCTNNLIYRHVQTLRSRDICICDNNIYYSYINFVIPFEEKLFNHIVIIEKKDRKYNIDNVKAPFCSLVVNSISQWCNIITDELLLRPNRKSLLSIIKHRKDLLLYSEKECYKNEVFEDFSNKEQMLIDSWKETQENKLRTIEKEISNNNNEKTNSIIKRLDDVENDCKGICEELLSDIFRLRETIKDSTFGILPNKKNAYVLDTSIYMHDPTVLSKVNKKTSMIIIPMAVKQELDGLQHNNDVETKKIAENALDNLNQRIIALLQKKEDLLILMNEVDLSLLQNGFNMKAKDNHIICAGLEQQNKNTFKQVYVVTEDYDLYTNAMIVGLSVTNLDGFYNLIEEEHNSISLTSIHLQNDNEKVFVQRFTGLFNTIDEILPTNAFIDEIKDTYIYAKKDDGQSIKIEEEFVFGKEKLNIGNRVFYYKKKNAISLNAYKTKTQIIKFFSDLLSSMPIQKDVKWHNTVKLLFKTIRQMLAGLINIYELKQLKKDVNYYIKIKWNFQIKTDNDEKYENEDEETDE